MFILIHSFSKLMTHSGRKQLIKIMRLKKLREEYSSGIASKISSSEISSMGSNMVGFDSKFDYKFGMYLCTFFTLLMIVYHFCWVTASLLTNLSITVSISTFKKGENKALSSSYWEGRD